MADKAQTESITLRLEQQIDSAADSATGALNRLERQIMREQSALGRLEKNLTDAKSKLAALAAGAPNQKAVQAFERQSSVVDSLRTKLALLESAGDKGASAAARRLAEAQSKLELLRGPAKSPVSDVGQYRKQQSAIEALTDKIGAQRDKIGALGEKTKSIGKPTGMDKLNESVGKLSTQMQTSRAFHGQMLDAMKMLGSRFGVTGSQAAMLGSQLAALGPYGAIAAAGILVVVGAAAACVSIFAKAMSSSALMREEFLKLQSSSVSSVMGFHWLLNSTRESSAGADRMTASINRVSASSALGRDKLASFAAQINQSRFYGKQAETVLKAMSTAGSGGTEKMAQDVLQMARMFRFAGGSVDDLAKRVEQKLGRTAQERAIQLSVQFERLGKNITWIFGKTSFDPLLKNLNSALSLFNAGSSTATGMQNAITAMVDKAINVILRLEISLLRGYIALRKKEAAWKSTIAVIKVAAMVIGGAAAIITGLVVAFLMIGPAIAAAEAAIVGGMIAIGAAAVDAIFGTSTKMGEMGRHIIQGLANGIVAAKDAVVSAITGVVSGAIDKAKKLLGIASPSRVFLGMGIHTAGGMAGGIRAGTPMVQSAAARMAGGIVAQSRLAVANDVRAPVFAPQIAVGSPAPAFGGSTGFRRGGDDIKPTITVDIHDCTFGAGTTKEMVRDGILEALESADFSAGRAA